VKKTSGLHTLSFTFHSSLFTLSTPPACGGLQLRFLGLQKTVQEVLETEMNEALGACKGERTEWRRGYRSGHYERRLTTRIGTLELRVPQDRGGLFRTEVFARDQRSEKALLLALAEMYVQGVSTRKVRAVTGELCGHAFSASSVSAITVRLDEELEHFARRPLTEEHPCLVLDARYERVREAGVSRARAVLVATGEPFAWPRTCTRQSCGTVSGSGVASLKGLSCIT
jgi:transposase-like protein